MIVKINGEEFFRVTSRFGDLDGFRNYPHNGIDLALNWGTPVLSPTDGVVTQVVDYGATNVGKGVIVEMENGNQMIFGHLSEHLVKVGDKISIGERIGLSGNTGNSTGAHLHLGVKTPDGTFIDPSHYIDIIQSISFELLDKIYKTTSFIIDSGVFFV